MGKKEKDKELALAKLNDKVIPINKPKGVSTYDCVRKLKRTYPFSRIGHAGSLDPLATGLVLILTGQATKLSSYIMDLPKKYRAVVKLGERTDTQDATGKVTERGEWKHVSEEDLRKVLTRFVGKREQLPPMYSALKHRGVPLYVLARRGEEVKRNPRVVETYRLELENFNPPFFEIKVHCSRGLYLRVLAEEIGDTLGVPSHLYSLVREEIGHFKLDDAVSIDEVERLLDMENPGFTLSEAMKHLKEVELTDAEVRRLKNGIPPKFDPVSRGNLTPGSMVRLTLPDKSLGAIAEVRSPGDVRLRRVFI